MKGFKYTLAIAAVAAISVVPAFATPSTTYWTNTTTYFQPFGVGHMTYDTYAYLGDKSEGGAMPDLAVDYGFTVGVIPANKMGLMAEVGIDYMSIGNFTENTFLNGKIGIDESMYGVGAYAGILSVPLKAVKDTNDYNVLHVGAGKTFGNLWVGAEFYTGGNALKGGVGKDASGFGLGASYYLFGGSTFQLAGDYYSGDNYLGAGGVGLYYYFAPGADILMGPVFYNNETLNGKWKWTVQVDVDFDLGLVKK